MRNADISNAFVLIFSVVLIIFAIMSLRNIVSTFGSSKVVATINKENIIITRFRSEHIDLHFDDISSIDALEKRYNREYSEAMRKGILRIYTKDNRTFVFENVENPYIIRKRIYELYENIGMVEPILTKHKSELEKPFSELKSMDPGDSKLELMRGMYERK